MRTKNMEKLIANSKLKRKMSREAHLRVKVADTVKPKSSQETFYYGLKANHERNVAVVHPLMFMMRRITYTSAIVVFAG